MLNREHQIDPLKTLTFDHDEHCHISIRKDKVCHEECENKPCTYICPSRVFYWEDESIKLLYKRCVECGACIWGCPYENIDWHFPSSGRGVVYKM